MSFNKLKLATQPLWESSRILWTVEPHAQWRAVSEDLARPLRTGSQIGRARS